MRAVQRTAAAASCLAALGLLVLAPSPALLAQSTTPTARLVPAPSTITLPSLADSNSPALWERVGGRSQFFILTSVDGEATRNAGALARMTPLGEVAFVNRPDYGIWFEAVIADVNGVWYGYYHNERPSELCAGDPRTVPRIGAARSTDFGQTWEDLGVVLEAPPNSDDCESQNGYFVGGVGDFSVSLDADSRYLYFFFSQYGRRTVAQGVSSARLAWADRDAPGGKITVWLRDEVWLPIREVVEDDGTLRLLYPPGGRIYPVTTSWHTGEEVDAFWGPSVHWNTYLQQYVMLLNRARDNMWSQEGVYVAYTATPSQPATWSTPVRLVEGGRWYPQVVGIEPGAGTDKLAGQRARFFMSGTSESFIEFSR